MPHEEGHHDSQGICASNGRDIHNRDPLVEHGESAGSLHGRSLPRHGHLANTTGSVENGTTKGGAPQGDHEESQEVNLHLLPFVTLAELRYLPTCAGIYFVTQEGGEVVYIGQSKSIRQRWQSHHLITELCESSDLAIARTIRVAWLAVDNTELLTQLESVFIRFYRPRLNRVHNRTSKKGQIEWPSIIAEKKRMLTAKEFAQSAGISYPVILRWLREQSQPDGERRLPGAVQITVGRIKAWQIPASLVAKVQRPDRKPKAGWKKGRKRKPEL